MYTYQNHIVDENLIYLRFWKCLIRESYLSTALILDSEKSCNLVNFPNNVAWKNIHINK